MPLREYTCDQGHITEELFFRGEKHPDTMACAHCENKATLIMSAMAKTAGRWGDSLGGVNGHYDAGLGCTYQNHQEKDRILRERGLVPLEDLGGDQFFDSVVDAQVQADAKMDADIATYKQAVKDLGSKEEAVQATWNAHDILHGDN